MPDFRNPLDNPDIVVPRAADRKHRLARIRLLGRLDNAANPTVTAAEQSLDGAFALADFVDAIRRAAEPL